MKNQKQYHRSLGLNRPSLLLALEPRMMFDGAGVATADVAVDAIPQDTTVPPPSNVAADQSAAPEVPSAANPQEDQTHPAPATTNEDTVTGDHVTVSTTTEPQADQSGNTDVEGTDENDSVSPTTPPEDDNTPEDSDHITGATEQSPDIDDLDLSQAPDLSDPSSDSPSDPPYPSEDTGNAAELGEADSVSVPDETGETNSHAGAELAHTKEQSSGFNSAQAIESATANEHTDGASPLPTTGATVREVVFIDSGATDYEALLADLIGSSNLDQDSAALSSVLDPVPLASPTDSGPDTPAVSSIPADELVNQDSALGTETRMEATQDSVQNPVWQVGDIRVVLLDGEHDGIAQISDTLAGLQGVAGVHIVSHGTRGAVKLGDTWLTREHLAQRDSDIAAWGAALKPGGDLLFYGCDLAASDDGRALVDTIGELTGADVAASTDDTGSAALDGNWTLEYQTGQIDSGVVFSASTQQSWSGLLNTFTVTNTNDSGAGSLRQAIIDANTLAGTDTIQFNIGGGGLQTIALNSQLDFIIDPVILDATTQPGYAGTPLIELDGTNATGASGGLILRTNDSTIKGFIVHSFPDEGIEIDGSTGFGDNNIIQNNWVGIDNTGAAAGNADDGILITVGASGNQIGGSGANEGNVVSSNSNSGITIRNSNSDNNIVQGNLIGVAPDGTTVRGNQTLGILIQDQASDNTIGGTNPGEGNVVAHSGQTGIGIDIDAGTGSSILGNSIFSNGTSGNYLGIDINAGTQDSFSVTQNDSGDGDSGPNNIQNFPVLDSAVTNGVDTVTIDGSINSTASTDLRIEFFASTAKDPSGHGEGERYIGFVDVTTDGSGNATFSTPISAVVDFDEYVTATATVDNGGGDYGDTSEFSNAVRDPSPTDLSSGIELNTDGGNDAYLIADDGSAIVGGLTQITVEAIFQVDTTPEDLIPILSYETGPGSGVGNNDLVLTTRADGTVYFGINGTLITQTALAPELVDGNVHHLAASWDTTNGDVALYVDGELITTLTGRSTGTSVATGGELVMGQEQDDLGAGFQIEQVFHGTLHDIRIWNNVRSAEEIGLSYQHKLDLTAAEAAAIGLAANWQMDGFNGSNEVVDIVNANNLSIGHATGPGFITSTPDATLDIDENSANGIRVGFLVPDDPELYNDIVTDGLFEEAAVTNFTHYDQGATFGGWTVDAGRVTHQGTNSEISPLGGNSLELAAPSNSTPAQISQTLTTKVGTEYQVLFAVGGDWDGGEAIKDIRVSAGATSADFSISEPPAWDEANNMSWDPRSFTFTAESTTMTLSFLSLDSPATAYGAHIADVQVIEVPPAVSDILTADPTLTYDAATGKFYRAVSTTESWANANSAAQAAQLNGVSGNLVSVRSSYENNLVQTMAQGIGGDIWIGATDQTTEGEFYWQDSQGDDDQFWTGGGAGSALGYENWLSGAPRTPGTAEDYVAMLASTGTWTDLAEGIPRAYVIEWDASQVLSNFTFDMTDTAGGRFAVDSDSGEITVANGSLLDYETDPSHDVTVEVTDAAGNTYSETLTIQVNNVAEPSITAPSSISTNEDTVLVYAGANVIQIGDTIVADTEMQVSLDVANGALTLANTTGITFVEGADGTARFVISGLESDLNTALDGLTYTPHVDYNGPDTLNIDLSFAADMAGQYTFENGDAADDSAGVAQDGVLIGDAAVVTDGTRGEVLSLDGDGDGVQISGVYGEPTNVTLAAWVNLTAADTQGAEIISLGNNIALRADDVGSGGIEGYYYNGTGWIDLPVAGTNVAGTGWNHLAYVFDDTSDQHSLYLNGELVAQATTTDSISYTRATDTFIGIHGESSTDWDFNGSIDDARVYTRALTADEIFVLASDNASLSDTVAITVDSVNDAPTFVVGDGSSVTSIATAFDQAQAVALQDDGKIVVAGGAFNGSDNDFIVARFNADGSVDTGFGSGGSVVLDLLGNEEFASSMVVQDDGKIVVGGTVRSGVTNNFGLIRLDSNGNLDTSFDTDGFVTTDFSGFSDGITGIRLQADGKIVASGYAGNGTNDDFALARYNTDGSLDTSFDGDGKVITAIGSSDDRAQGLVIQSDGKIVAVGYSNNGTNDDIAVVRYDIDGSLDTDFDSDGIVTVDISTNSDRANAVEIQDDGKIVIAAETSSGGNVDFAVLRLNIDGSLDTSFDGDGIRTTPIGAASERTKGIALQSDGKILLAGETFNGSNNDVALVRYNSDGSLDASFDGDGIVTTAVGSATDSAAAITLQGNGQIIVAGRADFGNGDTFVARYHTDGTLDKQFDAVNTLDGNPTFTEDGPAVVLDGDVEIFDADLSALDNFSGATLTLERNGGANAEDEFSETGSLGPLTESGNLMLGATVIGTVTTNSAGTLVLTFNGNATQARVNQTLRSIAYSNSNDTPPVSVQIDWTFDDGNSGAQGSGGALSATGSTAVDIVAENDKPVVTTSGGTTAYTEQAPAVAIDPSLTLFDPDGSSGTDPSNLYVGVVQITGNYEAADILGFTDTSTIEGSQVGNQLSLTVKSGQMATIAEFQAALRSVTFYNGSDDPGTLDRTISFTFDDGVDSSNIPTKTVSVTPVNDPPTVSLANTTTALAEDTDTSSRIKVADIVVSDVDSGTNTLSLSGADAALFEIIGTELFVQAGTSLDFETNPTLDVTVEVDDTTVGSTPDDTAALAISITDVNEPPSVSLANTTTTLPEDTDTSSRVKVADIVVTDDALGTNTLALSGADAALFEIIGTELFIQAGTALDFETNPTLDVTVEVDDTAVGSTPDDTAALAISITDVNEPPSVSLANTTTTLPEDTDTSSRVKVADIVVTDDALGTNTLSLSGADAALFEIVGTELFIQAGTALDFESNPTLDVTVEVDDTSVGATPDDTAALAITITDVNEPPSVSLANTTTTLPEDTDTSSRVKVADIVVTDDALGTNTLALSGADAALFEIIGTELFIQAGTALDFETNPTLDVTVEVDDTAVGSTPDDTAALAIAITDVNEPPSVSLANTTTTLPEDTDTSSRVKVADIVVTDDALGTNTLALSGADAALFEIIGTELFIQAGTALDFETNPSLDVTVEVDDTAVGSTPDDTAALAISITDVNEPPSVSLANTTTTLPEDTDTSSRVKVADIVVTDDALGTNTLSLSGTDAALFEIIGTELFIQAGTALDFETNPSLDVTIEVDDTAVGSTPDDTAALAISITDVNEPPSVSLANTTTTLPEDTDTSSRVKVADIVVTDDALGTNTLSLSGADAALFEIVGTELFIQAGTALDFETNPSLDVTIEVDDTAVGSTPDDTAALAISITDVNEPPSVSLANTTTTLPEDTDTSSRVKVADIVVTDDALGTNTLSLSGADAALFEIVGTELFIQAGTTLDFETNPTLDVTVEVDDTSIGATPDDTAALAITITNANEPPSVSLANTTTTLAEDTDTSSRVKVADIVITDDALGTNTLALSGADAALFEIVGTELFIQAGATLDFETNPTLDVTVEVDDTAVGSTPDDTAALAISITDVNEPPSVSLANTTITLPEDTDTSSRVKVADIVVTDDALGTNTLSLSGTDAALFEIVGTELFIQAGTALDFETNPSLDVTVEVDDTTVGSTPDDTTTLAIAITDVNEPPSVSLANTTTTLPEDTDTSSRVKVADIVITDDALGTNTLALSGADAALFEIVGTELFIQAGTSLDFETNPTLDVTVEVDDTSVGATPDDTTALAITITDVNEPPSVSLANTTTTLPEDTDTSSRVKVADIVVTDDALGTNTLALSGADAALFEIVGTELFIQAGTTLDFETNPTLDVTVEVDDTSVGATPDDTAALAISITDVNEPPSVSLANTTTTLPEDTDTSSRVKVTDIVVTDDALGTNTLALSGADAALFEIVGTELFIRAGTTLDFETNPTLDVTVEVDDTSVGATPDDTAAMAIAITDVNEPPSVSLANTTTTLPEDTDTSSRVKVADIVVTDDALGTNTLALSGADAALFEIVGTELFIQAGTALDFETNPTLDVTVEVDDTAVGSTPDDTAALAISITDVNEPPSVSLANTTTTLPEDTDTSSRVKVADIVVTDDALGTNTLSLSGADAALFEIIGTELFIQAGTALDFETNPSLDVTVEIDDTSVGATPDDTVSLAITITDVNEPPSVNLTNTTNTMPEDTDTSSPVKVADIVVTDDALGTNTLSLSGVDAALFEIVGTELFIRAGTALDFETNPTLDVSVEVDDTAVGATPDDAAALAISITDVNEPPSVSLANTTTTLPEDTDTSSRVKVADIVIADDALGTNTLTLSGDDAALFEIIGTELFIQAGTALDFETNPALDVTVEVDDTAVGASPDDAAALAISITDVNEPPSVSLANVVTSLSENIDTSQRIKVADIIVTDDALGTNLLFLTGTDAASFEIIGAELFLRAGTALDFETNPSLSVAINVDDASVASTPDDSTVLTINVTDVSEPAALPDPQPLPDDDPDSETDPPPPTVENSPGTVNNDPIDSDMFDDDNTGPYELEPQNQRDTDPSTEEPVTSLRNVALEENIGGNPANPEFGLRGFAEGLFFKPYITKPQLLTLDPGVLPVLSLSNPAIPPISTLHIPVALFDMLDQLRIDMDHTRADNAESFDTLTVAISSTVALSVGYVAWLLRFGALAAAVASLTPIWQQFDPLPVLASRTKSKNPADRSPHDAHIDEMFEDPKPARTD